MKIHDLHWLINHFTYVNDDLNIGKRTEYTCLVRQRRAHAIKGVLLPDSGKCNRCYWTFSRSRPGDTAVHRLRRLYTCKYKSHVQTENIPKKIK